MAEAVIRRIEAAAGGDSLACTTRVKWFMGSSCLLLLFGFWVGVQGLQRNPSRNTEAIKVRTGHIVLSI